jgi:hypothetical protein
MQQEQPASYRIIIHDRNYLDWTVFDDSKYMDSKMEYTPPIQPVELKLFSKDIFLYDKSAESIQLTYSNVRSGIPIAGILLLENNKTFGRTPNKKRLLYKCIPDDKQLPVFLIPYDPHIHFSKIVKNKFVLFKFDNWNSHHPHGVLTETIGDVNHLESFYDYQLHCKSLHSSLTVFTKKTSEQLQIKPEDEYILQIMNHPDFKIEDRTAYKNIFSIDPENSLDFDDAFSIKSLENGQHLVSIYISNVTIWMDALNLWSSFSQRISTIYLPDRKRPMLPTILSDGLCSLQQTVRRFAFVMDIVIGADGSIISINNSNCLIKVFRNYGYEEAALLADLDYKKLFEVTKGLTTKYKYMNHLRNSHDLVGYLMILMNYHCARDLLLFKNGIFRSSIIKKQVTLPNDIPSDVGQFIKIWNSVYIIFRIK